MICSENYPPWIICQCCGMTAWCDGVEKMEYTIHLRKCAHCGSSTLPQLKVDGRFSKSKLSEKSKYYTAYLHKARNEAAERLRRESRLLEEKKKELNELRRLKTMDEAERLRFEGKRRLKHLKNAHKEHIKEMNSKALINASTQPVLIFEPKVDANLILCKDCNKWRQDGITCSCGCGPSERIIEESSSDRDNYLAIYIAKVDSRLVHLRKGVS